MLGRNIDFPIYNADGSSFNGLIMHKTTHESVVMSLGDKLSGDVYYRDNSLAVTMNEYVLVDGVKYKLVNPPTIVREGMVSDNSDLRGMTKYSFVFYHPMYMLGNFPFTDIAVTESEERYLSQNKTFSWVGNLYDYTAKLNANLASTEWKVILRLRNESDIQKAQKISQVLTFDNNFVSDALKKEFDEWEIPYVIEPIKEGTEDYVSGKRFYVVFGFPSQEILDANGQPFVFRFGQGVGLKNNSRTPRNNKIVTRIVGSGSENNIPYGYPQIVWNGAEDDPRLKFPIYKGIVGGQYVNLIKHPFTRTTLMPSVYVDCVNKKVNPNATGYDPDIQIIDYYDADNSFANPCDPTNPCVEIHKFDGIKPELGEAQIVDAEPYSNVSSNPLQSAIALDTFLAQISTDLSTPNTVTNENERTALGVLYEILDTDGGERHFANQGGSYTFRCDVTKDEDYYYVKYVSDNINYDVVCIQRNHIVTPTWDDTMDDNGEYVQSYFKITLPQLAFDLYACASITEKMDINMRSGACIGCTFPVMVDWEDYKRNFYNEDGEFDPVIGEGHPRNAEKYPDTSQGQVTLIVQKDLDTFGTIMPNVYQQPKANDKFVILGISLPTSYITNAQQRLDDAMVEYMRENNVHYFDYPLKFDEYFLAQNTDILAQIHNNCIVRFEYPNGGNQNALYVKQIVTKYGDKVLPQYDITLSDDIEIVLNQIGQVTDDVSRMRVQLNELQKYYSQNLIDIINQKLSKVEDDIAQGRITFQQGLDAMASTMFADEVKSNNFKTGLYTGRGWRIDNLGNAEFESARVRSFLEVVEILVNRMRAQEGDTLFTDNDQIDKVEVIGEAPNQQYLLSLKEKFEGYITPQRYGNILSGIINTLAAKQAGVSDESLNNPDKQGEDDGGNKYYTSWMHVTATHETNPSLCGVNQILVALYGDTDVPSRKNFVPCELMTIARRGCVDYYIDPTLPNYETLVADKERRQRFFMISNTDGRVVKYSGVTSPTLLNGNYGVTIGELPDFVKNYSEVRKVLNQVGEHTDWLYAQGIVVGNYVKVNREGLPEYTHVDCGEWVDGSTLQNPTLRHGLYLYQGWHEGHKWRCLVNQPRVVEGVEYFDEPKWNSTSWQMIEGNDNYSLEFLSSNGYQFRRGAVNTLITPHLFYGNTDITADIDAGYWNWERDMEDGDPTGKETWDALHAYQKTLTLTNDDLPVSWSSSNKAIFTCKVSILDGENTVYVENQIIT